MFLFGQEIILFARNPNSISHPFTDIRVYACWENAAANAEDVKIIKCVKEILSYSVWGQWGRQPVGSSGKIAA